jgi:hypothetical protein
LLLGTAGFGQKPHSDVLRGAKRVGLVRVQKKRLNRCSLHHVVGHAPIPSTAGIAAPKSVAHDLREEGAAQRFADDLGGDQRQGGFELRIRWVLIGVLRVGMGHDFCPL